MCVHMQVSVCTYVLELKPKNCTYQVYILYGVTTPLVLKWNLDYFVELNNKKDCFYYWDRSIYVDIARVNILQHFQLLGL